MMNPNQPIREYLSEDFLRMAVALVVVIISMAILSSLERQSSFVSHLISLPSALSATPIPVVPSVLPGNDQLK